MAEPGGSIFAGLTPVAEREAADASSLDALLRGPRVPFVIRGLARDWPLVQAGLQSPKEARRYLEARARSVPFAVSIGSPGNDGRLFYDAGMDMNFRMARGKLADIFEGMDANEDRAEPPTIYLGSIDNTLAGRAVSMVDFHAPDFSAHPRFARALDHAQVAELEPGDALFIPST